MGMLIYVGILVCAIVIFAVYISKITKPYWQSESEKEASASTPREIKTEFETVTIQAEVIDMSCRVDMVGTKTPKAVTVFTVTLKTDNDIIQLAIPEEMYEGLEVGLKGEATLVEGELYSFII
jgi:hypothetical protein